jgi:hypothetical protein
MFVVLLGLTMSGGGKTCRSQQDTLKLTRQKAWWKGERKQRVKSEAEKMRCDQFTVPMELFSIELRRRISMVFPKD